MDMNLKQLKNYSMNVGIFLGHPAHFHNLKIVAQNLQKDGHKVFFAIKEKDILEALCKEAGYNYTKLREGRRNGKWALIKSVLGMEYHMYRFVKKNKINLLVGTTLSFTAAKINRIPVFAIAEDDAYIAPRYVNLVYPFATEIFSPISCDNGRYESKSTKYPGFQKLTSLHPNYFQPNKLVLKKNNIDDSKPYFLMRFASLNAHHDEGVGGISTEVAQHLIDMLSPYGKIYITSERPLESQFEQYRLHIDPLDIHHVMAYATIYIGDSQSMANEAAMLGTPSLRFNSFVGDKKIGVMEELEHVYGLTFGISSREPEQLYAKVEEFLALAAKGKLKEEFQTRRQKMLHDKIDVTAFFTWFIENYPSSSVETKKPDFNWNQFK